MDKAPGIYRLQNLVSGKFYIGSTKNIYARYYRHRQVLRKGLLENIRIKEDCDKYGKDSFIFGVVEYCNEHELLEREQSYFDLWKPEYNVWKHVYDASGRTYTEEQLEKFKSKPYKIKDMDLFKEKLRLGWIKRKQSQSPEELSKKLADARRGIKHTEDTKKKMSENRKGKPKTESFKQKTRERRIGTKLVNGHYLKVE